MGRHDFVLETSTILLYRKCDLNINEPDQVASIRMEKNLMSEGS